MLKSTMQRLTKETCGHFKRTGEEPSTTEKTKTLCFERYIDVLNVVTILIRDRSLFIAWEGGEGCRAGEGQGILVHH